MPTTAGTTATAGSTSGVPGAGPGDSIAMVNLPTTPSPAGRVNVAFLPLQGRVLETFTALIRQIELGTGSETFIEPLATPISFVLNGSEVQQRSTSVPVPDGTTRLFDTFFLNIDTLVDDPSPGVPPDSDKVSVGDADTPFVQELALPANIRVFPSRETTVPIFLNDAMIQVSEDPQIPTTFLPDIFQDRNHTPIEGFLSDFLKIDISSMGAKRPIMSNGQPADAVYFSGDRYAFSAGGSKGYFELLTSDVASPTPGEFQNPVLIGTTQTPGIYRTLVPDPTDPSGNPAKITELLGIFRLLIDPQVAGRSMLVNAGNFEVILMPRSTGEDDMQILLIALDGAKATNLYWGDARIGAGSFVAYPVANLATGSAVGAIQGSLTGYLNVNGAPVTIGDPSDGGKVRYGRYALGSGAPQGFKTTGRFVVYRR